jgi:phosphatidylglycerophosphate synthase
MDQPHYVDATRILTSALAPFEKRCLIWIARRLPRWMNSDHLTSLGFAAMVAAGFGYALARWNRAWLAAVIVALAVNWFGDSLDGTLARVRGHLRPRYGFYIDHVLDAVGVLCLLGGLAYSGLMTPLIALGLLVTYYLLSIEVYLATHALGTFRMTFWNVGPTELRILLAIGTLRLIWHPTATILGREFLLFDVGGAIAIVALFVTFLLSFARNGRTLYRAEPLPDRRHDSRASAALCANNAS